MSADDVGFDGVTVREAIASRTLLGLERLMQDMRDDNLSFEAGHRAITVLLETTMPFCDPGSQVVLRQVEADLKRKAKQRSEVDRDLAIMAGDLASDTGAWGLSGA